MQRDTLTKNTEKQPSQEVQDALKMIFMDMSLEEELTEMAEQVNGKYANAYVPLIDISDPHGLLEKFDLSDVP